MIFEFFVFIFILGLLIFIHEFFHFLAAKRSGVRVEEFGFGLPPRLFGKKIGQTLYSINLLPFGGFVKIYGEERIPEIEKEKSFAFQKPKTKAKIILAGVVANFLLGILIFYIVLWANNFEFYFPSFFEIKFPFGREDNYPVIVGVEEGSPAQKVGLRPYDLVISFDGKRIFKAEEFVQLVGQSQGKEIVLVVENLREKTKREVKVVPRQNPPEGKGALGVQISEMAKIRYQTLPEKIFAGFLHSANVLGYSFRIFGRLIALSFQERAIQPLASSVTGPVGIFFLVEITLKEGFFALLNLVALLSLSLAVVNLLPFPGADGGRMVFVLYESIAKKPVPAGIERKVNAVGYFLLIVLLILITFKDIKQFLF